MQIIPRQPAFAARRIIRYCAALILLISFGLMADEEVVNYWHVGNYDEVKMLRKIAAEFKEQSGISVRIQPLPWGNFQTKYFTAMASGEPPDAGATSLYGGMDYGKVGGVIDLEARYPEAVARLKERIFPDMWPNCYFKGHLFAIPYNATALIGFYRRDIFYHLGLKPPKTWSEFTGILDTLTANGYYYGFLWTKNTHWGLGNFTWSYGEDSFSESGTKVNWTSEGFLKGYQFAVEIWNSYNIVSEKLVELFSIKDPQKALPLFFNYEITYSELLIRSPHLRDKFGIFPFPYPEDGQPAYMMGGRALVIFRDARNPDAALKWLEFLMSKDSQLLKYRHMADLGDRSALDLSVDRQFWQEDLRMRPGDQEIFFRIFSRLKTRQGFPWLAESQRILEQSLYHMEETLRNYHNAVANQYGIAVRELKRRMAAGELPQEQTKYRRFLRKSCLDLLSELAPLAQEKLDIERRNYLRYYGQLHNAAEIGGEEWDVLDYSEAIIAIICLAFLIIVFARAKLRRTWQSYVYIAPPVISALVFIMIPVFVSLFLSFTKYNPVMPLSAAKWVGAENYLQILSDEVLWQSMGRSLYFALLVMPLQLMIGVILAACLDKNLWPDRLYKFLYFSPLVTSIVSVSLIWYALYSGTEHGWINSLLLNLKWIKDPLIFLRDKDLFLNCVILMTIWQGLAFTILIFLAGFQNIPTSQYEAAAIDGAGAVRQFFHVSLPNLRPQFTFLVVMGTIGAIQVFEQIYMLGGGAAQAESKFGPEDSGMTIVPFIYRKGFEFFKMGEASAVGYILFIVLFFLTFINLKMILKKET